MNTLPFRLQSDAELQATLRLKEAAHYNYLRQGCTGSSEAPGRSESERLEALRLAFTVLQVPPHMSEGLFKVLAAILWLGNVDFEVNLSVFKISWIDGYFIEWPNYDIVLCNI